MKNLDDKIKSVLKVYNQRMLDEEQMMKSLTGQEISKRRDEFLLPVGEEVAQFLFELVKSAKSKVILEVGTSYGYSTIWLAAAAQQNNGKVITLELDEGKADFAKSQIEQAGLSSYVEFIVGDALESIVKIRDNFDFVLLDIWKDLYIPCIELIHPKLNPGAFVIADNINLPERHKEQMEKYRNKIKETRAFDSVLLPLGSGIEVSAFK